MSIHEREGMSQYICEAEGHIFQKKGKKHPRNIQRLDETALKQ